MASDYINYLADARPSIVRESKAKWELAQKYVQNLDETTEHALDLVFGPYPVNHFGCYVATRIFSSILTPGKKNGLMSSSEAPGPVSENLCSH